ncbi:MAG TPA: pyridoxal-phosphate dependent enzyme [Kofleriaceae bacterium]|nr:pyridoxal-phosphate dependent enzyme [Kofleriaceae bacterium]
MIFQNITSMIGRTPVVQIRSFGPGAAHDIYLKLEGANPGASIKDRAALGLILDAERKGLLKPGATLVESTSGNLGKSLAMIGCARGYRVVLVMDVKVTPSVVAFCRAFGAVIDMIDEPDETGSYQKPRLRRVKQLLAEIPDAYWPNQYDNPANPAVHEATTAKEIIGDLPDLDYLVASVSTGGHLSGVARAIKRARPSAQVIAVDALGSSVFGFPYQPFLLNGIGLAWTPGNVDLRAVDEVSLVRDADAYSACRLLAQRDGVLIGGSGGAVLFTCLALAARRPGKILGIAADTGANYLDTIYNDQWIADHGIELVDQAAALVARARAAELIPSRDVPMRQAAVRAP